MRYLVMPRPWDHANLPGPWAAAREAEGWDGLAVGDHWYLEDSGGCIHPFVALAHAAAHTDRMALSTAYANNLCRSPVELAQAALSLHYISNGRFELGIGTGWAERELLGAGLPYPSPAERVSRLAEAVHIVRALFEGECRFEGDHYQVDLPAVGVPTATPPALSAALGGPVALRTIGPLVDIIEISTPGLAFRRGRTDLRAYGRTQLTDLQQAIERARNANPSAQIGLSLYVFTGTDPTVERIRTAFSPGCYADLAGEPARVAEAIQSFAQLEVDRITVMPPLDGTAAALAPYLLTT